MVHINRVELTNFKSFGGTTSIPLLPGFTVVSGPNGSGKSNILDALLFALGLSSSKGMRAERLPDLVNNSQSRNHTVETIVTVSFDLSGVDQTEWLDIDEEENSHVDDSNREENSHVDDNNREENSHVDEKEKAALKRNHVQEKVQEKEWTVTRKLRVTKQGTYTSTYYINGQACTQTELHEQLNRLRIYPEGYNVVLQGDVTSIISMNGKERREIIDELAGVAQFDRKIVLAKEKLEAVREQEEKSQIVENELIAQRDRLSADRLKAEKYQKIRNELQEKLLWEIVLKWQHLRQQEWQLREQIEAGDRQSKELNTQLENLDRLIHQETEEVKKLDATVKALGESELLALQASLNSQNFRHQQLLQQQQELAQAKQKIDRELAHLEKEIKEKHTNLDQLALQKTQEQALLLDYTEKRDRALVILTESRENATNIASTAEAWVQQQNELHHQVETIQNTLDPQKTERATLQERESVLHTQIQEKTQQIANCEITISEKNQQLQTVTQLGETAKQEMETLSQAVNNAEQDLKLQQDTHTRLLTEQRDKHRQLDKLEAQAQVAQEVSGSQASKLIIKSGISGVCGLVAQLGKVEPRYQLALEISAGARMGFIVVEDDHVAAQGINLLKQKKAGRATFLPLNKMQKSDFNKNKNRALARPGDATEKLAGFIDYAINLIEFDPRYQDIFGYVFGQTMVFETIDQARRYLGQYRMVTLDGEVLETTGAMTGGSVSQQSSLHFGTVDENEDAQQKLIDDLQKRLAEIELILQSCEKAIARGQVTVKEQSQAANLARQNYREHQLKLEQIRGEIENLTKQEKEARSNLAKFNQDLQQTQTRLTWLDQEIPIKETELQQLKESLAQLESGNTHSEWQTIQGLIRNQEKDLQTQENAVREAEQRLTNIDTQQQLLQETLKQAYQRLSQCQTQQEQNRNETTKVEQDLEVVSLELAESQSAISLVEARLGSEKENRDRAEKHLRDQHLTKQQLEWQLEKLTQTQAERRENLANLQAQLATQNAEIPDPLPTVPDQIKLEDLEKEVKSLQKKLQALEPVNMLALEEYEHTQARLTELTEKIATLTAERTDILLRIENFTTLRLKAFHEAFNAVNQNFQGIFAELSDGDGFLQLDNPEDPFSGGLNLVAHPKGKPVQRLASMSGGEKSLTALSFIFSLQRYRPSTFYAFDEVDMFLDGANVEKLSRMIKRQAEQAQFIVVSLRRPMIESAQRTIGVTQARGAYTQVLGIKLT